MSKARYAVVFDLDGTLIDSRAAVPACLALAFTDLGIPANGLDPVRLIGPPLRSVLPGILRDLGVIADVDEVLVHFREHYVRDAPRLTVVYDGVPDALDDIGKDFVLAIATSKPDTLTLLLLEELGLGDRFAVIAAPSADANEDKRVTLSRCADLLGDLHVEPVVMVGDHRLDVEAAIAVGLASIGVTWGMATRHELQDAGATIIVDHPTEVAVAVNRVAESVR